MKRKLGLFQELIYKETGLGQDVKRNTIDVSNDLWNEKIKINVYFQLCRNLIDPCYNAFNYGIIIDALLSNFILNVG